MLVGKIDRNGLKREVFGGSKSNGLLTFGRWLQCDRSE